MRKLATFAAALSLAACTSSLGDVLDSRPNSGPCPSGASIYDSARIVEFASDELIYSNITYSAEIVGVRLFCKYADGEPLLAEVELDFAFGKGPQADARTHVYPYYVAVTRRNSRVLSKQHFAVEADFRSGEVAGTRELIGKIVIPRADESISGANFEILVGFDLTPEQLEFNRAGKRFRLDAGTVAAE